MTSRSRALALVPVLALALTGCSSSPENEVRDGVSAVIAAANDGDAQAADTAVDDLLDTLREQIGSGELTQAEAQPLQDAARAVQARLGELEAEPSPSPEPTSEPSPEPSPTPEPTVASPSPSPTPEPTPEQTEAPPTQPPPTAEPDEPEETEPPETEQPEPEETEETETESESAPALPAPGSPTPVPAA